MDRNTKLTPNFSLREFVRDVDPMPSKDILNNLWRVAQALQMLRDIINLPIHITSGYRTPQHNIEVGGSKDSYHVKGMAVDFVVQGMPPKQVQSFLKHWSGGLGRYTTWTHLDIGPKRKPWGV